MQSVRSTIPAASASSRVSILDAVVTSLEVPNADLTTVYQQSTVQVENRGQNQQSLSQAGVSSAFYDPVHLHLQKVHENLGYSVDSFPVAEQACTSCLSLPMFPPMIDKRNQTSLTALIEAVSESRIPNQRCCVPGVICSGPTVNANPTGRLICYCGYLNRKLSCPDLRWTEAARSRCILISRC